ncbi:glutamate dehydrogenase [Sphingomonas jejuensis]|uniref:Glutamate dehydrogenase n=1 Tax=Sphingomonas jejuensis TaxID=904715 RepID=A0ABX0XL75_9SPHN|nr:NAD-glutamate dehydrogenase domain-containing protein [Sphingomonas jejuensis]NJC33908.1 glutamate dehydrogenase [Sphingomonas jejuensis]
MATATRDRSEMSAQELTTALATALTAGLLPGEGDNFGDEARDEAARFLADVAARRPAGQAAIRLESVASDRGRQMRLAVVNDDMPFLVDSVAATMLAHDLSIDRVIHPVVTVRRDADGKLLSLSREAAPGERRESVIYMEVERADARTRRILLDELAANLVQVRAAVSDWPLLQEAMRLDADRLPDGEGAALMRWLLAGNFTLLAHERRSREGQVEAPLGIARVGSVPILSSAALDAAARYFDDGGESPLIVKSNLLSVVHRRVPLDVLIVPRREDGRTVELSIHAGLWTSAALNTHPAKVPLLRTRLAQIGEKYGFDPAGHAGKALAHALSALPHDLLIAFAPDRLEHVALTAMSIADRPRAKLLTVLSALGRHLFCFVWLPRDELSTARRGQIADMLTGATGATILNWSVAMEDGAVALLRYTLDMRGEVRQPDAAALDAALGRLMRGWTLAVEQSLSDRSDPGRAARLALRYAAAFPQHYRTIYLPGEAAADTLRLSGIEGTEARDARLLRIDSEPSGECHLKVYSARHPVPLSDIVPALENFGFRVMEETSFAMDGGAAGYIHDFRLSHATGADPLVSAAPIEQALSSVLTGTAENDVFNRLIIAAGVEPRAVTLFRAWFRYLRQTGLAFGYGTVVDALTRTPAVARGIVDLFGARHDPDRGDHGGHAVAEANRALDEALAGVAAADDDRILRLLRALVSAILRTNAFAPAAQEALAFKLDSHQVPGLPAPVPWREIWVYSPRVEGIHLRAGPVARGGLRWSDRRDDFRTEILGLMKAQRVKNAVIVPTGAKGGFYPKHLPDPTVNRDAWMAEGTEAYRIFIRTLLSITDNIEGGRVVHPDRVVIRDGEDPYFVVAADKGTASFSDVANRIALDRGFWLGDAFASGGSNGYDHKAMGITAKGAWVSVQRHFAEAGVDVQTEEVTVAGVGDMSGDVFGNGMLLSETLKIVAAFDHRHIFLDPTPDPARSFSERARLFALPRSSWDDYDKSLISDGGGVWPRSAKSIDLPAPAAAALGIEPGEITPSRLLAAILRAPVDLLWFGGIGTYVKAKSEANTEVGDPANDGHRVNAEELRAKVIGEGANLGVTQAARIAFAAQGGRINTDFIDNSAGVDCSDNEVNIKIVLNREMTEGRLGLEERNSLLASMTDDVARLVLEDNRLQTLALSIAEANAAAKLPSMVRLIETFEASGKLDRTVEGLGANDELLRRAAEGRGLTRPELAVVLSTAKLALQDAIEDIALASDDAMKPELHAAFPPQMQDGLSGAIDQHQLRPQIVATKVANTLVNRMGLIHPFELAEEEGATLGDIATMFAAAERLFDMPSLWAAIDAAPVTEAGRIRLFEVAAGGLRLQMADLLRTVPAGSGVGEIVAATAPGLERLRGQLDALLKEQARQSRAEIRDWLAETGAPDAIVQRIVTLFDMDGGIGLSALAQSLGKDEIAVTRAFTRLGEVLGLDWAQNAANRLQPVDPWERLLASSLSRDFQQLRLDFLRRSGNDDPERAVDNWLQRCAPRVKAFKDLVRRARLPSAPTAAMLAQIAGQARVLLGR